MTQWLPQPEYRRIQTMLEKHTREVQPNTVPSSHLYLPQPYHHIQYLPTIQEVRTFLHGNRNVDLLNLREIQETPAILDFLRSGKTRRITNGITGNTTDMKIKHDTCVIESLKGNELTCIISR